MKRLLKKPPPKLLLLKQLLKKALTPLLLALGLEEFSLHPGTLLEVRRAVRAHDLSALRAAAPALLRGRDREAIRRWLENVAAE